MSELEVMPTEEDVMDALSNVIDPELGLDFVELGLIYGVEVAQGNVKVTFTLTTPGCPIGPQVNEQIEEFVGELDGVKTVESEMVFSPPWSPDSANASPPPSPRPSRNPGPPTPPHRSSPKTGNRSFP